MFVQLRWPGDLFDTSCFRAMVRGRGVKRGRARGTGEVAGPSRACHPHASRVTRRQTARTARLELLRRRPRSGQLYKAIRNTTAKAFERRLFVLAGGTLAYYGAPERVEVADKTGARGGAGRGGGCA